MKPQAFLVGVAVALLASGCTGGALRDRLLRANATPTPIGSEALPARVLAQLRDFDFAVETLRTRYYNPKVLNEAWEREVNQAREAIARSDGESLEPLVSALSAVIEALGDDNTLLLPPSSPQGNTPRYGGIGVLVDMPRPGKDRILVLSVYPDSPAERADIRPHDAIIAIEGEPVTFEQRDTLLARLRGEPGTSVTISVRRPGQGTRTVRLTRQVIEATDFTRYRRIANTDIGYILPAPSQPQRAAEDIADALRALDADAELGGLILDLRVTRSNEFPVEALLRLFVNGRVGWIKQREQFTPLEMRGVAIAGSQEIPLVVLVSELTSGPAEALAGLLQSLGRAYVVGTPTAKQAFFVETFTLPVSRAQLVIPTGEYLDLTRRAWQSSAGVTPNPASDRAWETFTEEDDPHLRLALDLLGAR